MKDYLLLEEFAAEWAVDRGETMEETRAGILKLFWEGRFERLGYAYGPGTILAVREETRNNFTDQCFDGMPYGREAFFTDVFFGPGPLPDHRNWVQNPSEAPGRPDPGGKRFKLEYLGTKSPEMLRHGYCVLKDCPFEKYLHPVDKYLQSLGFPIEMLAKYFTERLRHRPPFLVRAQANLAGFHAAKTAKGPGRKPASFAPAALETWMQQMIERLESAGEAVSADEAHRRAKAEFHPTVPRTMVRQIYKKVAPADWGKRGPKPRT
jgi:hypothetical protein